ncbi:transaldolase family protein [Candidatus Latescibacterota bacterium]
MKLYLDTANLDHIREAASWGVIDGVTTNPSLIKKAAETFRGASAPMDMESYIKNILAAAGRTRPVSLEVAGLSADDMVEQGMSLYELFNPVAGNVVIKIPVCTVSSAGGKNPFEGLLAISRLDEERIPVNATLIFTPEQALLAAKAGADYVSPFAGRIDDRIRRKAGMTFEKTDYFPSEGVKDPDGMGRIANDACLVSGIDLITQISAVFEEYEIESEIIAASLRNPIQVREAALSGADIATIPFEVLLAMVQHPGTADGIDAFTADLVEEYLTLFTKPKPDEKP